MRAKDAAAADSCGACDLANMNCAGSLLGRVFLIPLLREVVLQPQQQKRLFSIKLYCKLVHRPALLENPP